MDRVCLGHTDDQCYSVTAYSVRGSACVFNCLSNQFSAFFLRIKTKMVQKDAEARMLELNGSHIYSEFK